MRFQVSFACFLTLTDIFSGNEWNISIFESHIYELKSTNIEYYSRDAYENKDRQFDFFASERFQKFRQFKVHNIQYSAESARDVNFVEEQMKAT